MYAGQRACFVDEVFGVRRSTDGGTTYRSFCIHVRNIIAVVCGIELVIILWTALSYSEKPLAACRVFNVTSFHEISTGRGPAKILFHEKEICSPVTLLLCFTAFHAFCDLLTLTSILVEKHNLVLPLLIVLILNIIVSILFLLIAGIAYIFSSTPYDFFVVLFIVLQALFRLYEFSCARKLYWYFQWAADQRNLPQCSLLQDEEEESSFQL